MKIFKISLPILIVICLVAALAFNLKRPKRVIFAYGDSIHYWGDHEHQIVAKTLAEALNKAFGNKVKASAIAIKSDADFKALKDADAVVILGEGEKFHPFYKRENLIKELNDAGVSFGILHYALQPEDKIGYDALDYAIGGHYEPYFSVNPTFVAEFKEFAPHPVSNGVRPFTIKDEWYFNIHFASAKNIVEIAKVIPPDAVRKGRKGAHSGNDIVRKNMGKSETILWVCENENGTRAMGFTGGHALWNFINDDYRKLVLNSVAWLAKLDVPSGGINSARPKFEDLEKQISKQARPDIKSYKERWQAAEKTWNK